MSAQLPTTADARFTVAPLPATPGTVALAFAGSWLARAGLPSADALGRTIEGQGAVRRVVCEAAALEAWDTGFLAVLHKLDTQLEARGITLDTSGLPEGVLRLLALVAARPERAGARKAVVRQSLLEWVGRASQAQLAGAGEVLAFIGEVVQALGRLVVGRPGFRRGDFLEALQEVGAQALPIVGLVSFLVGCILAFLGAVQLLQFGAQIFVADLVAIGMARDMAAMMVGIILAGRTGAAFAAQLGSMQVNEEIDALATMGLSPMSFLVLPRMLALILMTPLLVVYANVLGMLGGMAVGVLALDLPAITYLQQTQASAQPIYFLGGLIKGTVYGIIVAVVGCLRGMQCGRSASAVGQATTSAVVTSIVFIIVAMAILTLIYNALGI